MRITLSALAALGGSTAALTAQVVLNLATALAVVLICGAEHLGRIRKAE